MSIRLGSPRERVWSAFGALSHVLGERGAEIDGAQQEHKVPHTRNGCREKSRDRRRIREQNLLPGHLAESADVLPGDRGPAEGLPALPAAVRPLHPHLPPPIRPAMSGRRLRLHEADRPPGVAHRRQFHPGLKQFVYTW